MAQRPLTYFLALGGARVLRVRYRIKPRILARSVGVYALRGLVENVTIFDTQRDLTDRQGAHTRCPCTHSKAIGHYYSREARKP